MERLLDRMIRDDIEQVVVVQHRPSGLRGFIVIHDTSLGPAFGGTRLLAGPPEAAFAEAVRWARAATDTLALAGFPAGGGAAVLIDDGDMSRAEALNAFATWLNTLGGRFRSFREHGLSRQEGWRLANHSPWFADERLEGLGDLEAAAALGVVQSLLGGLEAAGQPINLNGVHCVLQSLVGRGAVLARVLAEAGATVTSSDTSSAGARTARELGVATVTDDELFEIPSDVVVLNAVLDDRVFSEDVQELLRGRVICDASSRTDLPAEHQSEVAELEITWVPGFLCNAGPLITVAGHALTGRKNHDAAILAMRETTRDLLKASRADKVPAIELASRHAARFLKRPRTPHDVWQPSGAPAPVDSPTA